VQRLERELGVRLRLPLVRPVRAADNTGHVRAVVHCAQAMSKRLGWLTTADQTAT
jgi:hypothetical protein